VGWRFLSSVSSSIHDDDRDATRLNIRLQGDNGIHNPESLDERDRNKGLETPAKRSSIELKGEKVS
jgi:hypothetical protein